MFSKVALYAAVALSSSLPAMAAHMVQPQNVQQCMGHEFSVSGTPPFQVTVWPGCNQGSTSEDPLETYECHTGQFVWNVNQKEGTSLQFVVVDAKNEEYYSHDITVGKSGNSQCLGKPAKFGSGSNPKNLNKPTPSTTTTTTTSGVPTTQSTTTSVPYNVVGGPSPSPTTTSGYSNPLGGALKNGALHSFHLPLHATALLVLSGSVLVAF